MTIPAHRDGSRRQILSRHLIPTLSTRSSVNATFTIADAILTLSALSFLG